LTLLIPASSQEPGSLDTRWHGQLKLSFHHHQDQTSPHLHLGKAPLKVQRPFYPEGPATCHTTILHTAGGLVRGDQLSIHLDLHPQAQALVTTAAASKIYGSPTVPAAMAEQTIHLHLAANAHLEWLPQETIVFAGAHYRQSLQIELAPGASCLGWELTRFGRTARGERFSSGQWQSQTEIWQQGHPLWINRESLTGGSELLDSPYGLSGHPLVGTLFWVGGISSPDLVAAIRQAWQLYPRPGEAGVSSLEQGVICRYRGPDRQAAQDWFVQVWQLLRQHQQRPPACLPRVWPL
jgi:urease accessory protein